MILTDGKSTVEIASLGAIIKKWKPKGEDKSVIFPFGQYRRDSGIKTRGGMFPCFPNFGPPQDGSSLPQHGFMRNSALYNITENQGVRNPRVAHLCLETTHEQQEKFPYPCKANVDVEVVGNSLLYSMFIHRMFYRDNPRIPLGMGLHPYFRRGGNGTTQINIGDNTYFVQQDEILQKAIMVEAAPLIIITLPGVGIVTMEIGGLFLQEKARIVIWTDSTQYICIEPIVCDHNFFNRKDGLFLEEYSWRASVMCELSFRK